MFKEFLYPLVKYYTPFNIFKYITFRAAYASITALLITFLLGPHVIKYLKEKKLGEKIRLDGPKTHMSKVGTPTMGGILIIAAAFISIILWQDITDKYTLISLIALLGFGLTGFLDDYIKVFKGNKEGLSSSKKILFQFIVSSVIILLLLINKTNHTTVLYIPMVKGEGFDLGYFYIPFAFIVLIGTSNAVNLTDGLDGLATGICIMVFLTFAILSYVSGRFDYSNYLSIPYIPNGGEFAILSLAMLGACVGFLWYNSNPAEIFMGDTGSLTLGGMIGTIALILKKELLLIIIGGVFVMEAVSVIIQVTSFKLTGKRVFLMTPIHHHFEKKGWAENKIVMRLWILGGMFSILALSVLKLR